MRRKKKVKKQPPIIEEDDEGINDDLEPKTITLSEEQRLMSKNIVINCPICNGKIQLRNEIEIKPNSISCRCNPCSFKISKNDKTMAVSRDEQGDIKLDCQDHSISFSFNRRQVTPENEDEKKRYEMISDVMGTPRNKASSSTSIEDLDWENDLKSRFLW